MPVQNMPWGLAHSHGGLDVEGSDSIRFCAFTAEVAAVWQGRHSARKAFVLLGSLAV
jgi:hypothetical protein